MIDMTLAALREIQRLQNSRQKPDSYLRLGVKAGGCSGWYYTLELSEEVETGDRLYENQGIKIVIAGSSQPYLQSLRLDYAEDLMGGGFRFHNPQAADPCSCGLSFSWPSS